MMRKLAVLVFCLPVVPLATPAFAQEPVTVQVPANQAWTQTGLTVQKGEVVSISSSGQVKLSPDPNDVAEPAGRPEHSLGAQATLPGLHGGALIGRIDNGNPFAIGSQASMTMPASGELFLGVDDDFFNDNSGTYSVTLSPSSGVAGTSGTSSSRRHLQVPANEAWTDSGISVRSGEVVSLSSSGQVKLSPDANDVAEPAGRPEHFLSGQALLPGQPGGTLIGRVGTSGQPFAIGNKTSVTMPASGELYLGIDDDYSADNSGSYSVDLMSEASVAGTSGSAANPSREVQVPANRAWTRTGISVRSGEVVQFSSSGEVKLSADPNDVAQPAGRPEHNLAARATLPGVPGGALIGRIGNGKPFAIGDQTSITMPASGELYLGVDDDLFTDNSGQFVVTITQPGGSPVGR